MICFLRGNFRNVLYRPSQLNVSKVLRGVECLLTTRSHIPIRGRHARWRCVKVPSFREGNRHFAQGRKFSRMADETNEKLAGTHLAYLAADRSGPVAQRLYAERYLTRRIPSHNFFASLQKRLAKIVSCQRSGIERVSATWLDPGDQ